MRLEQVALALLTYIEERTDGFRILVRDQAATATAEESRYSSLLNEAVNQVAHILAGDFGRRGFDARRAGPVEGSGGRAPGEPVLERSEPPRGRPRAQFRMAHRSGGGLTGR
ncbi:transcriptional regulator [Mycobacteroides abscessus subsp. abscessus]|nr:transcriptional regulator [Mycobacteroides abscessus subsp. abscessus]